SARIEAKPARGREVPCIDGVPRGAVSLISGSQVGDFPAKKTEWQLPRLANGCNTEITFVSCRPCKIVALRGRVAIRIHCGRFPVSIRCNALSVLTLFSFATLAGCNYKGEDAVPEKDFTASSTVKAAIGASGSTFVNPLMQRWIADFHAARPAT